MLLIVFETVCTLATKLPQFGGLFDPFLWHFRWFFNSFGQLFTGLFWFLDFWTVAFHFLSLLRNLWYTSFWLFLRFSNVFTCIQFKNKLISPIFSDMFWPNFTNNPCKTTTGIPSKRIRKYHSYSAHMKCLWNLCKT